MSSRSAYWRSSERFQPAWVVSLGGTVLAVLLIGGVALALGLGEPSDPGSGTQIETVGAAETGVEPHASTQRGQSPESLNDPRLKWLRRAWANWNDRLGKPREVVDQVCLVRNLDELLRALEFWDGDRWFPILWADARTSLKFVRAFRPARVVRLPELEELGSPSAEANDPEADWDRAVQVVGRSWVKPGRGDDGKWVPGDQVPDFRQTDGLGRPGVVLSSPTSPSLAGAIALAAGRFQPLVRWDGDDSAGRSIDLARAGSLAREVERRVVQVQPRALQLGDGCDFLTLAVPAPDRFNVGGKPYALDDLIGRNVARLSEDWFDTENLWGNDVMADSLRWAFVGRLRADPAQSLYQAMCSLFLQPDLATLFNTYELDNQPWSTYRMDRAGTLLKAQLPTILRQGNQDGSLSGWHATFGERNRAGLTLINTSGGSTQFNIRGGPGIAADIPPSVPTAVAMIHSFSAERANDPETLAGRWLDQGSFLYYGSLHEPYLAAFRMPTLVADLLVRGLPFAAAVRMGPSEPLGRPWKLAVFGDPLYQLDLDATLRDRRKPQAFADWPAYEPSSRPVGANAPTRLAWTLEASLATGGESDPRFALSVAKDLLSLDRSQLGSLQAEIADELLAEQLSHVGRLDLLDRWEDPRPVEAWAPGLRHAYETRLVLKLERSTKRGRWNEILELWSDLVAGPARRGTDAFLSRLTNRISSSLPAEAKARWARDLRRVRDRMQRENQQGNLQAAIDNALGKIGGR